MLKISDILRKFLIKYVYQDWNIAIADIATDLTPINIKWMKHKYKDRWFADPFILEETEETYTILAEECMHSTQRGRLARLTVSKNDCTLLENETLLDLDTHLSFPNPIRIKDKIYIYPENGASGNTKVYKYTDKLELSGILSDLPLADAVIFNIDDSYYLFATLGEKCNGNELIIFKSSTPLSGYEKIQEFKFSDNIARRAGAVFETDGKLISPAQICNNDYGEGVSLQEISVKNGRIMLKEIKRIYPLSSQYPEGFHTYNIFNDKVVVDGYRYGSRILHNLYFKLRH